MPTISSVKHIRIGHSPDPDDAFMFYALAKQKIPIQGFTVEHVIEDIETLNQWALGNNVGARLPRPEPGGETPPLHVTAVSCHAYAYMSDKYVILHSGASVGDNYGPILVARDVIASPEERNRSLRGAPIGATKQSGFKTQIASLPSVARNDEKKLTAPRNDGVNIRGKRIAIPGKLTTAYLVLQLFDAENSTGEAPCLPAGRCLAPTFEPVFIPFDQILDAVIDGKADFGLVIHEGQITYAEKGLSKVLDLGKWWQEKTKLPLPLGIDVIRRDLGKETIESFAKLFKQSIVYALDHRDEALEYALEYGRGISKPLGDKFVGMYVNDYTVDLGPKGEQGLCRLLDAAYEKGLLPHKINLEFV